MFCHAYAHVACNWPTDLYADAIERESKIWAQYLHVKLLGNENKNGPICASGDGYVNICSLGDI